jgi:hypothetical protein
VPLVALCDRDDEAQVRVDHALLRRRVSALDALGEGDLVGRGQQRPAAGLVHEQGEAVDGTGRGVIEDQRPFLGRRNDLDAALLELCPKGGLLLLVELVLVRVGVENLLFDCPELLRLVDEGAGIEFSKLGQVWSLPLLLEYKELGA